MINHYDTIVIGAGQKDLTRPHLHLRQVQVSDIPLLKGEGDVLVNEVWPVL